MTDISLTMNSKTFTFASGEVKRIASSISTGIENNTISASGPSASYTYDYEGVAKTISISGILFETGISRVSGYSIDKIVEQKQWLESLANGAQGPITFTSNYESLSVLSVAGATAPYQASFTYTYVKIGSLTFEEIEGNVEELKFSIQMTVGQ
jgi:hypothetical protein